MTRSLPARRGFLAAGAVACLAGPWRPVRARAPLEVAVVPQFPAAALNRDWGPLLDQLARSVGAEFRLLLQPTIPRFEVDVLSGAADLAYLNPYHQVMAHRDQGYLPLVRSGQPLRGLLLVRKDDPLRSVKDLEARTLAFPAPNAFGASLLLRALLTEREKLRFATAYVQTHGNVYRHVLAGLAVAGGTLSGVLARDRPEVRGALRVLYETPAMPAHPIAAHPRLDAGLRRAIADALVDLARQPEGQDLLRAVEIEGLVRADHECDYRPLEAYRLERYVVRPGSA